MGIYFVLVEDDDEMVGKWEEVGGLCIDDFYVVETALLVGGEIGDGVVGLRCECLDVFYVNLFVVVGVDNVLAGNTLGGVVYEEVILELVWFEISTVVGNFV